MARTRAAWRHAATVALLVTQTLAQQCYYPNGSKAPDTEKPCSSAQGSACCPDSWECLDNGLCHNPSGDLYGRYSCTDQSWKSPGCASNMCTYNMQAGGGEAVTQCSNHGNQWCCDADRTHVNCCQESPSPRPFFRLQDGQAYATIGGNQASSQPTLASFTGLATGSGGGSSPSSASSSSSSSPAKTSAPISSAARSSVQPVTSERTSVSSGPGGVQTIVQTLLVTPSASATDSSSGQNGSSSSRSSGSHIGLIVGCAVGVPLALALLGIIIWMLRKRRQNKSNPYGKTPEMEGSESPGSPGCAGGAAAKIGKKNEVYRHSRPGTSEIDGAPAGPGRPISTLPGRAELDSGAGFQPGHNPYGPDTVGIGGGNGDGRSTWGSAPPGYSPGANQTAFAHHGASELDGTSVMPVIDEKAGAREEYQAYQPPQAAAELPTIKTPPEDVEKQMPSK